MPILDPKTCFLLILQELCEFSVIFELCYLIFLMM